MTARKVAWRVGLSTEKIFSKTAEKPRRRAVHALNFKAANYSLRAHSRTSTPLENAFGEATNQCSFMTLHMD